MSNASRFRFAALLGVLVLALAVAGCGSGPSPTPPAATSVPTALPSPGGTAGAPTATLPAPGSGGDRPDLAAARVSLETVASGFAAPLVVTSVADGSGRLFVAEQVGRIRIVRDGLVVPEPFLDISDRVTAGGERGLLGLAFPPGFGDGWPLFYVHYSDSNGDTAVSGFRVASGAADTADADTEWPVLREPQPYANHNGGWIGFDADGMLLIALGDGGAGGDPENRASDLDNLLGKMLRVDVLGANAAGGEPYLVPADNPFAEGRGRGEILHVGLRNPFRSSIDLETGDLWIGDVGQGAWEEVDVARAGSSGLDFGWRRWEGRHCYNPSEGCDPAGVTQPVAEYGHDRGCSIIGGVVYRGDAIPDLRGAYLFSDYCSGTLWAIDSTRSELQEPVTLLESGRQISSFGIGEDGEVYLTDLGGGELLRLVPAG
jgi:glucose/arabinose dehydrogenase